MYIISLDFFNENLLWIKWRYMFVNCYLEQFYYMQSIYYALVHVLQYEAQPSAYLYNRHINVHIVCTHSRSNYTIFAVIVTVSGVFRIHNFSLHYNEEGTAFVCYVKLVKKNNKKRLCFENKSEEAVHYIL